jgi:hypothetical protein
VAELEVSSVIPTVKKQMMKSIKNTGTFKSTMPCVSPSSQGPRPRRGSEPVAALAAFVPGRAKAHSSRYRVPERTRHRSG